MCIRDRGEVLTAEEEVQKRSLVKILNTKKRERTAADKRTDLIRTRIDTALKAILRHERLRSLHNHLVQNKKSGDFHFWYQKSEHVVWILE